MKDGNRSPTGTRWPAFGTRSKAMTRITQHLMALAAALGVSGLIFALTLA